MGLFYIQIRFVRILSEENRIFRVFPFFETHKTIVNVGGRGGIRTHGSLATTSDFESDAFNHSATLPLCCLFRRTVIFFTVCVFHAMRIKINPSDDADSRWQKRPVTNLVGPVQSGKHYARFCGRGKLIWKPLKTGPNWQPT
jgi:hypothetical protein